MTDEHRFDDRSALAEALARDVAHGLEQGVAVKGRASLVVSGGSTPLPFFAALRTRRLPWERVSITLADDRWVPADHPRSNEGMVRRELLAMEAAQARFVGLVSDHPTPEAGLSTCRQRLVGVPRPFDVVVLGMGSDGHTASLFPGSDDTAKALDPHSPELLAAVQPPGDLEPRITLTLAALLDSSRLVLHIAGEEKWKVYREARSGAAAELPIAKLLRTARQQVEVYWAP